MRIGNGNTAMKRWALILGLAGAFWIVFVLYRKSLPPSFGQQLSASLCCTMGTVIAPSAGMLQAITLATKRGSAPVETVLALGLFHRRR
jgi:hypothetical protein